VLSSPCRYYLLYDPHWAPVRSPLCSLPYKKSASRSSLPRYSRIKSYSPFFQSYRPRLSPNTTRARWSTAFTEICSPCVLKLLYYLLPRYVSNLPYISQYPLCLTPSSTLVRAVLWDAAEMTVVSDYCSSRELGELKAVMTTFALQSPYGGV
jgi:hypothetical protein